MKTKHFWTKEEEANLRREFPHRSTQKIADEMELSYCQVSNKAYSLQLKKTEKYLSKNGGRFLGDSGIAYRFPKGNVPHNKGKKMDASTREKVKRTWFKKGHKPHNTKYDGYERIDSKDGYVLVRVEEGIFKPKHHLVWEEYNGPISKGNIVVFKDKNVLNICIENLECISKAENMRRNSIQRYPAELVGIMQIRGRLNNQIKKQDE